MFLSFLCDAHVMPVLDPDTLLLLWRPWRRALPENCCCKYKHCLMWSVGILSTHVKKSFSVHLFTAMLNVIPISYTAHRSFHARIRAHEITWTNLQLNYEPAKQAAIWAQTCLNFILFVCRIHSARANLPSYTSNSHKIYEGVVIVRRCDI